MPFPSILVYLCSLAVMGAACRAALSLAKSYRHYFLSSYVGYLIAIGTVFILNLVASDLSSEILKGFTDQAMVPVYILFGLVAFPLFAVAWYLALAFMAGILEEDVSPSLRTAYIILWSVLFGIFLLRIQYALGGKALPSSWSFLNRGSGLASGLVPLVICGYFLARAAGRARPEEKRGLLKFGAIFLAGLLLMFAGVFLTSYGQPRRWAVLVLFGLSLFAPLWGLKDFLSRCYRPVPVRIFEGAGIAALAEARGLSRRETEILGLLLRGKSNKDIEKDLFISPHTVRNHIHNIYQKLGVGSRLQLMNLVRESASVGNGS